jgi:hypothetical protein
VLLLHRPEMYAHDDEQRAELEGQATLIVAKHRNGPVGDLPLTFLKECTRFENCAGEEFYSNNVAHRQGGGEKLKAESGKQEEPEF